MRPDLYRQSVDIILRWQEANGAYVACPAFEQYKYCWLRDGTFIAYAMDRIGRHESAAKFYGWVDSALQGQRDRIESILARMAAGVRPDPDRMPPARFNQDGTHTGDDWPNFQLDGYGAWLWGLAEHVKSAGDRRLLDRCEAGIGLSVRYLEACWHLPNYDCWEEHGGLVHPSTLACLYGGLTAINHYLDERKIAETAAAIRAFILDKCVMGGRFVKSVGRTDVDANLLWLTLPFGVVEPADPRMAATVSEIERLLYHGGVHRYAGDTYYGGGEWILLAAWLGWYYCAVGRVRAARGILAWIEAAASPEGELPEQVSGHLNSPEHLEEWRRRWGEVARPLLWSHAMYLILADVLAKLEECGRSGMAADGRPTVEGRRISG